MNKYKEIFDEQVAKTVDFLKNGKTILYPTDTIWGLGCDATDANAVNQIYKIKMRPPQKSMIILIDVVDRLFDYVTNVPPMAVDLVNIVRKPLSVIYPNAKNLPKNVIAADGSIAIRMVKTDFCKEVIRIFGKPIVSTSANITGNPTPMHFSEISQTIIKSVDFVVDKAMETSIEPKASTIARFKEDGEFEIIRA
ncbi:MAG: threonylcarbamoyl-AMP synthase [Bacteroidales bacterium]|nr:threonylcarbamoyl-AMP synthase [Bacteroidales bacterium]MBR5652081.1 threonylcarbamoyl-AMP synthase [Bacteroidales bacterium]MBR5719693.1 threonylcarbamoyl-AMP synthase [Bacteroidales bacterium]